MDSGITVFIYIGILESELQNFPFLKFPESWHSICSTWKTAAEHALVTMACCHHSIATKSYLKEGGSNVRWVTELIFSSCWRIHFSRLVSLKCDYDFSDNVTYFSGFHNGVYSHCASLGSIPPPLIDPEPNLNSFSTHPLRPWRSSNKHLPHGIRDNVFGIETGRSRVRIPAWPRDFTLPNFQTSSGSHLASYSVGTGFFSQGESSEPVTSI